MPKDHIIDDIDLDEIRGQRIILPKRIRNITPGGNRGRGNENSAQKSKRMKEQDMPEFSDRTSAFSFTYKASRYEHGWLINSLGDFYEQHWLDDVLRMIKGGKEASVYLCAANPRLATELIAAKVYRPRQLRNLRNDFLYREGRTNLDNEGREILEGRMLHAIQKRTSYGQELIHTSWIEYEFQTLITLHTAGADVPTPYSRDHNAILMTYIGDKEFPAPTLNTVSLSLRQARRLFDQVVNNIEIMLSHNIIHGDLSAFNILFWDGEITLIDFPQVVQPTKNISAFRIFDRDLTRVCEYFSRQGVKKDSHQLAKDIWTSHHHRLIPEIPLSLLKEEDPQDLSFWENQVIGDE